VPQQISATEYETWLYQPIGEATISTPDGDVETVLREGCCCVLGSGNVVTVTRPKGSVGILVRQRQAKSA
jgi:hypothetical protein